MIGNEPWREDAACQHHDPRLWFPEVTGPNTSQTQALRICSGCTVRTDCLAHATAFPERHGIWGGATESEREKLAGRPRCGTTAGYARHRRVGSEPCQSCRDATNAYKRARNAKVAG